MRFFYENLINWPLSSSCVIKWLLNCFRASVTSCTCSSLYSLQIELCKNAWSCADRKYNAIWFILLKIWNQLKYLLSDLRIYTFFRINFNYNYTIKENNCLSSGGWIISLLGFDWFWATFRQIFGIHQGYKLSTWTG